MSAKGLEFYRHGIVPEDNRGLNSESAAVDDEFDVHTSAIHVAVFSADYSFDKKDMATSDPNYIQATEFAANEANWAYINEQIMLDETRDMERMSAMVLVASR